jgi:outer membrane lipoprotein carrier protein
MVHAIMLLLLSQPRPIEPKPADVKPPVEVKVVAVPMAPDVKALVDRVQAFYEKTTDFTAEFKQDYLHKAFKRTQTSTGKVTYAKPALMRWDYVKPSARTFVLAKDRVLMLDPEAMTLTIASIATSQLSASVTFLWGQGKLADEFSIAKKDCKDCKGTLLELTPLKPDPRFQKVLLEVDPKSATVIKSTVIDPDGSENAITFGTMQLNTGVDAAKFKLEPPPGTQVIDYTKMKQPAPAPAP